MRFEDLLGKTLVEIAVCDDTVTFTDSDDEQYRLYHYQDCCESVWLEEVHGDLNDLIGSPLLLVEEYTESGGSDNDWNSQTFTFYKMATVKGHVTLRWIGESNGYYSESVDFVKL